MKTRREDGSAARCSHGAMDWRFGKVYVSRLGEKGCVLKQIRGECEEGRCMYGVASAQRQR